MCISKKVKIDKNRKARFKKFQVKNRHFPRKTTVKGPKKGSQGGYLDFRQKRGFRRGQKTTFFGKHIRIKGKSQKTPISTLKKVKKNVKKTGVFEGKKLWLFVS